VRRWVCDTCGSGVNAPERPRRDDVRRYCLDCSKASGRLVERTCPSVERRRAASSERAAAKRATDRATDRQRVIDKRTVGGLDLLDEASRLWRLPVMREQRRWQTVMPLIEWRRTRSGKARTSGHAAYGSRRIVVTIGTDPVDAVETVLHELVHVVVGAEGHSEQFYRVLVRAAREAWTGIEISPDVVHLPRAWQRDSAVTEALRALDVVP
jgi:hypothetical protein